MPPKKKKQHNYTPEEKNLLKESEDLIKELIIQLKIQLEGKKNPNVYALPNIPKNVPHIKQGVYNGIGSMKTSCTGCKERLFAPLNR